MKTLARLVFLLAAAGAHAAAPESARTPENQVFQFAHSAALAYPSNRTVNATAHLWIPEHCRRVRGLLILARNVTEHTLVGHPALRAVCTSNDLGIVWCVPSFHDTKNGDPAATVAALQTLLDGLAATSGYSEVATVPWLPLGESAHLVMVNHLLDAAPDRCLAAIHVKNAHLRFTNRTTPILLAAGTAQEWDQEKKDLRTAWTQVGFMDTVLKDRAASPGWPASVLVEGGSGHFDCTESMARYFAQYIDAAARARLPEPPDEPMKPVVIERGFVAGLPLPRRAAQAPSPAATASNRALPWFFTETLAREAVETARINWSAALQIPAFADGSGAPVPFLFRGITSPVPCVTETDGVTFAVSGVMLERIPDNFLNPGDPLQRAPGSPTVEWICGAVAPADPGKFRIALDRTWPDCPVYLAVRHRGTADIRDAVHPGQVKLTPHSAGAAQTITFPAIPDQRAGTAAVPLQATSDSGLPVRYFVNYGPAVIRDQRVVFTPIPPRAKFPVAVSVTAWQWGRATDPPVRTAQPVTRTFHLTAP